MPNENLITLILRLYKFFSQYVDTLDRDDFDTAYRLGDAGPRKGKKPRSRPIVVKFFRESVRNQISQIRFDLDDDSAKKKIYVNDDLPKVINDRRSLMTIVVKSAKQQNIPAKMSGGKVTVNHVSYSHRNLDCLPKGLRPEDVMMKDTGSHLYFSSEYAWPSNFYPANFVLQGMAFTSAEQAFQCIKARRNGYPDLANMILRSKDAKDAKKSGKGVTPLPSWDKIKDEVMRQVIQAKFQQNDLLTMKLVETAGKVLVEATIDKYWAANATLNSKSVDSATWKELIVWGFS